MLFFEQYEWSNFIQKSQTPNILERMEYLDMQEQTTI